MTMTSLDSQAANRVADVVKAKNQRKQITVSTGIATEEARRLHREIVGDGAEVPADAARISSPGDLASYHAAPPRNHSVNVLRTKPRQALMDSGASIHGIRQGCELHSRTERCERYIRRNRSGRLSNFSAGHQSIGDLHSRRHGHAYGLVYWPVQGRELFLWLFVTPQWRVCPYASHWSMAKSEGT